MILDQFRLDGRVALVTGARQGLGQGFATALAEAGADVAGLDRADVDETGGLVAGMGRRFKPILCDLRAASVADLNRVVEEVAAELGRLDILVNNAGIIRRAPALEFSEADWDDVLHINLKALFFMAQAAAKVMAKQGGGKIVNVASMLSRWPTSGPNTTSTSTRLRPATWRPTTPPRCAPTRPARPPSWTASRPAGGGPPPICRGRSSSWRRRRPITCTAPSCRWTAAG
jgi:NAD(P)-dependent dehydrogenase (short-subunit alcohol dehydrogenase family)